MGEPIMVSSKHQKPSAVNELLSGIFGNHWKRWSILLLLLSALSAIILEPNEKALALPMKCPTMECPIPIRITAIPSPTVEAAPDPYAKYNGQAVQHPRREPDRLVRIKISRYDPALGGTNCFRWGNGTCLSPMANGERWEVNYDIAIACPALFPFGTIIEIGGTLWICKDRGGAIRDIGGVYWVDQLSRVTYYAFGTEMLASVWFPK